MPPVLESAWKRQWKLKSIVITQKLKKQVQTNIVITYQKKIGSPLLAKHKFRGGNITKNNKKKEKIIAGRKKKKEFLHKYPSIAYPRWR